jgi:hypothetical protein
VIATLRISGKVLGKTQAMFTNWEIVVQTEADRPLTLGQLIAHLVAAQGTEFEARQEQQHLRHVWSMTQVVFGIEMGKIAPGDQGQGQGQGGTEAAEPSLPHPEAGLSQKATLDQEAAVVTALQGFRDGLYLVFIDEVQQQSLDQAVTLRDASQVLFLRLVALVGG